MAGFWANAPDSSEWTVTELTQYIRDLFEIDYRLKDVNVSGEISNYRPARSGHLYFTLKDQNAQIKCVMWRSAAERLRFSPQDGDAVVVNGRISVYEASGVYQLYAERMDPAGRGDLAIAFEEMRHRLESEGLFDAAHKKRIPPFPQKIGIVTSADAAALRDILNVLARRFPLVSVLIAPTLVQGATAPPQIVRALQWLDGRHDIDTIIVARGGGSIEDLWAFNDESVARAIFAASHPVIVGVGHETDFTIADFVADLRAPTPSAAAEQAVPDITDLIAALRGVQQRLITEIEEQIAQKLFSLTAVRRSLQYLNPQKSVDNNRQRLDGLIIRLDTAMRRQLDERTSRWQQAKATLAALSPQATLDRGYAIVRDENGRLLRTVERLPSGTRFTVQLADGRIAAVVVDQVAEED